MNFLNLLEFYSAVLDSDTENISEATVYLLYFLINRGIPATYFPGKTSR